MFLDHILKGYFCHRPTKKSIDGAYKKLKDKTKNVRNPRQLDIISDFNKRIYAYIPDGSKYQGYAWDRHVELDHEVSRISNDLQTEVRSSVGGKIGTTGVELQGGRQKTRKAKFV
jgi:hypothetical protein